MNIRSRILGLEMVKASEIQPNNKNWRTHPSCQEKSVRASVKKLGFVDALIARRIDGVIELLDGHLRKDLASDSESKPICRINPGGPMRIILGMCRM